MAEQEKWNFSDKETREKIKQEIAQGFFYHPDELKKWHKIRKGLEEFLKEKINLKETDFPVYEECVDLLNKAKWFSSSLLPSDEFVNLFRQGLSYILSEKTYPLKKSISLFLIDIPLLSSRDEYKTKIREAMFLNEEKITSEKIIVNNKSLEPTIGNWLKFYDMEVGAGAVEKLKTLEILFKNENITNLPFHQRETIKRLIDIYEELKISAMTVEGLEEEDYIVNENEEIELHRRNSTETISKTFTKTRLEQVAEEKIEKERAPAPLPLIDLNQAVDEVVKKINLTFPDKNFEMRFRNIIISFFKDARTEIETKIILKRDSQIGGMRLNTETADRIMEILKEEKPRINKESLKEMPPLSPPLPLKSQLKAGPLVPPLLPAPPKVPPPLPKPAPAPSPQPKPVSQFKPLVPVVKPKLVSQVRPVRQSEPVTPPLPPSRPAPSPSSKPEPVSPLKIEIKPLLFSQPIIQPKPMVKDKVEEIYPVKSREAGVEQFNGIKIQPRVYGPVDELKTITLVDWRRWGSAKEAAKKIQDKINLLAEESLVKKAEGIKAWKDSEVNQLYLNIGVESINQGKSVNEIIIQRRQQNKPFLSEEEFNAVVELNQKLRF